MAIGSIKHIMKTIAALHQRPMTNVDIYKSVGCAKETARVYTQYLHEAGLIYIAEWRFSDCKETGARGPRMPVWTWQPGELFGIPDVPRPLKVARFITKPVKPKPRKEPRPPRPPRVAKPKPDPKPRIARGEERRVIITKASGFTPPAGVARSIFDLGGL
ncbi:MAG: hypothetical protein K0Q92_657 [Steroidobacteraceae bacterium]|jgi:hypothetical protein|nr:hypothetical protein [Steroidobacteraceae bacterium]